MRDMINNERYVDFNKKPLPLMGLMFVSLQVKGIRDSKSRVLEVKQIAEEFPNLFERRGFFNKYSIKIEMKENAHVTQLIGRRIPIHLQKQVNKEINNLREQGHKEKIDSQKLMFSYSR